MAPAITGSIGAESALGETRSRTGSRLGCSGDSGFWIGRACSGETGRSERGVDLDMAAAVSPATAAPAVAAAIGAPEETEGSVADEASVGADEGVPTLRAFDAFGLNLVRGGGDG